MIPLLSELWGSADDGHVGTGRCVQLVTAPDPGLVCCQAIVR